MGFKKNEIEKNTDPYQKTPLTFSVAKWSVSPEIRGM